MKLFSEADREAIRKAVQTAEGETSGEIVPFIVGKSDDYGDAVWRMAAAGAIIGLLIGVFVPGLLPTWGIAWLFEPITVALSGLVFGAAAGVLARYSPPLLRFAAGSGTMAVRVHRRAMEAFVEEEVFDTRERTGILLFVSLLEHRIEVVGDSGINARVDQDDWAETVHLIRDGVQNGRTAEGLVAGIQHCGTLLRQKGVEIREDDSNELSDGLRFEEE